MQEAVRHLDQGLEVILCQFYHILWAPLTKGEGQQDSGHLAFKDGSKDPNPHLLYQRPTGEGTGSGAGQFLDCRGWKPPPVRLNMGSMQPVFFLSKGN